MYLEMFQKDEIRMVCRLFSERWVQYIGSERVNQKGVFRLLILERKLSSERWLILLIRNFNVKSQDDYGTWDNFATSLFATLALVNEARKKKLFLTQKHHHSLLKLFTFL